jgi:hypothetical protein
VQKDQPLRLAQALEAFLLAACLAVVRVGFAGTGISTLREALAAYQRRVSRPGRLSSSDSVPSRIQLH